ncbi:PAAR domain-containing protein [Herbaspirillum huttiense]|uniref:PAAR domain-containing protein n=1 Tax=Herbaspirillum huttiense TaxID=863372 RepID=UPI003B3BC227
MAIIGFIVMGDRTSHGGVVMSGDPTWTVDGQPIARIGDKVSCPRCKRVATISSSRFPTIMDNGQPVVYDQDVTDCGAILYSRHNNHAGWGSPDDDRITNPPPEQHVPRQAPRFQEHFVLRNNATGEPLAGVSYLIKTGDGRTVEGETDAQGRTDVVWTDSPLPLQVIARPKPMGGADPYHVPEWRSEDI